MNSEPTIKPASSLIITRQRKSNLEVLLGRRADSCRFMPGLYVFPGGGLKSDDYATTPANQLDQCYVRHMGVRGSTVKAQALAIAAIRETYEECGLLFGGANKPNKHTAAGGQLFNQCDDTLSLRDLHYIGRGITPASSQIRFCARFFTVDVQKLSGRTQPSAELEQLIWLPVNEHPNVPMADITKFILANFESMTKRDADYRSFVFTHKYKRRVIRWQD